MFESIAAKVTSAVRTLGAYARALPWFVPALAIVALFGVL